MLTSRIACRGIATTVATVGLLAVADARAEVLLASSTTSAATFGGATYIVDFNGSAAGGTTHTFTTAEPNTRVMITFNAECAVDGPETRWVDIDILVNPAGPTAEYAVSPSNGDNAFCSGNGTTTTPSSYALDGWVSAATVVAPLLPQAGNHTVRIRVNGANAGVTRLDDMSLTVIR